MPQIHGARQRLVGVITDVEPRQAEAAADGVTELPERWVTTVALYRDRTSSRLFMLVPPGRIVPLELELTYPAAGAFRPSVGTRLAVTIEPVE